MADSKKAESDPQGDLTFQMRRVVNQAYSALRGQESVQTFAAYTLEDALDEQIEAIEGSPKNRRANKLEVVDSVENDLLSLADKIKKTPPEAFTQKNEGKDVNTPKDGTAL